MSANIFYYDEAKHQTPNLFHLFNARHESLYVLVWYSIYPIGLRFNSSIRRLWNLIVHVEFDSNRYTGLGLLWLKLHISFGNAFYIGFGIPVWYRKRKDP